MRSLLNFLGLTQDTPPEKKPMTILPPESLSELTPEQPPYDDATRPSYRIGGDRTKDFHRVIDLSG